MIRQVAIFGAVVNLANTTAGLAMITSIWERSNVGVLLLGLALLLFLLYRSFTRLGERHKSLETLHDFTRQLGGSLEIHELEQRSEEHTSELQSLMRISYAVSCLKKKN